MKDLQSKILKLFLLSLFILYSITTITDGIINYLLDNFAKESSQIFFFICLEICLSIGYLVLAAFLFSQRTKEYFLQQMEEELQEKNFLFASIAHDLKSPLTLIKGYSTALEENKIPLKDIDETYKKIYKRADEINHTLDSLLDYSSLGLRHNRHGKTIDLAEELRQILGEFYPLLEEHQVQLESHIPLQQVLYFIPREDFKRLVENLLKNVIDHNDPGTRLLVELKEGKNSIELDFADSGKTIPMSLGEKIFDPFVKADTSRQRGKGTGLGLASVKKILQENNGEIVLLSPFKEYSKSFSILFSKKVHKH